MKILMRKAAALLAAALLILPASGFVEGAENPSAASGSWGQINQALAPKEDWVRFAEGNTFALGGQTDEVDGVPILDWGTYPSIDGSTVCVPLAMELARQWLALPESDLTGFVNFSTTPYAYERLIRSGANPAVTLRSRGAMLDDTHPVDLVLATYPNADELKMAADAGADLVYVPFCYDAFVFLVNAKNPVDGLTAEQIRKIYGGYIFSWSEVGGPDIPIAAYQRPHGSGSQTAMEELVMQGAALSGAEANYVSDGMADLVEQIGNYDNGARALGYSYLYYVDSLYKSGDMKVLSVDGIAPTEENLRSGAYPYTVCYWAVFRKGDANTAAFVDWLTGEAGQRAVRQAGYIPVIALP